jgi:hypothetical protein
MATSRRSRHDDKGADELCYIHRLIDEADAKDTRSDEDLEAEIERLRGEATDAYGQGFREVFGMVVDRITVLKGCLERRKAVEGAPPHGEG